eukprot:4512511-Heterocapsa_arctica.AAC.1
MQAIGAPTKAQQQLGHGARAAQAGGRAVIHTAEGRTFRPGVDALPIRLQRLTSRRDSSRGS